MEYKRINNTLHPIYNDSSEVLILGSMPSVKSREKAFYYAHTQNRFWKVLEVIYNQRIGETAEEKTLFLLKNHIALWDVIQTCDIINAEDNSIKNVIPEDISRLMENSNIKRIFINGKTAAALYDKHIKPKIGLEAMVLPSTSPANAVFTLDRLIKAWRVIKNDKRP